MIDQVLACPTGHPATPPNRQSLPALDFTFPNTQMGKLRRRQCQKKWLLFHGFEEAEDALGKLHGG
jgi:hypothetical protein